MFFTRYQEAVSKRSTCRSDRDGLAYEALGLASEAGEVAGEVHKAMREGRDLNMKNLVHEMGDTLWFLAKLAHRLGYTLEELALINIEKLKDRDPAMYGDVSL